MKKQVMISFSYYFCKYRTYFLKFVTESLKFVK